MSRKGSISQTASGRSLRAILTMHVAWLLIVFALGTWWSQLVLNQVATIAELQTALGLPASAIEALIRKTHRIVFWEWGTFYILLIAIAAFLVFLYWRDTMRVRSLHAFFASVTHE